MAHFTTDFFCIPASAVRTNGANTGRPVVLTRKDILSSLAGVFAVSPDTALLITAMLPQPEQHRLAA